MANVSPDLQAELSKDITNPVLLLEIQFDTPDKQIIRATNKDDREYNGHVFSGCNPDFQAQITAHSDLTIRFPLPDSAIRYYSLAMSPADGGTKVKLWQAYGEEYNIPDSKIILRFDGFVTGVPHCSEKAVEYQCRASHLSALWTPRIVIAPPLFNHLPKDGTRVGNIDISQR